MKTVRTPEPGHTGYVGSIHFVDGVAEVDDDAQELTYFRSAGYQIEDDEPDELRDVDGDGTLDVLPKKSASTEDWRAFAVAHGVPEDVANSKSRDELVAHFYEEGGQ